MNTINDELLACYVEGTATPEEQILVRDYLTKNPEEYERVLYMMDLDREDYINEQIENSQDIISITDHNKEIPTDNSSPLTQRITLGVITACVTSPSINSIATSAAAFVPPQSMKTKGHIAKRTKKSSRIIGLQDRLNKLLNQIE